MLENNKKAFVKNASSEKQVKEAAAREELMEFKAENCLRFVLSQKEGRKFYWELLAVCGLYAQSADNSGSWTYFNEGKRSIGLKLLADVMSLDSDLYSQMVKENKGE